MGLLNHDHPDILKFVTAKKKNGILKNFNLSVSVTDEFMKKMKDDEYYNLINPRTEKIVKQASAKEVFERIIDSAWDTGDPGIVFIDEINRHNPLPKLGRIESTNPCGEAPLLPYESCNLGSVNLSKMTKNSKVDWAMLERTVRLGVRFLDSVIDKTNYPFREIKKITLANRKIGVGIMGFAEMLIKLGVPYDSEEALKIGEKIMKFINENAHDESSRIGREKGDFPNFKNSTWAGKFSHFRNAVVSSIAPTGSISIIAGTTSGIEPLFAVAFVRRILDGSRLMEINPEFERISRDKGFYSKELMMKIAETGGVQGIKEIPDDIKKIFKTALDIKPEWHIRMQAVFQKHVDNAVSKTINLPEGAGHDDVRNAYLLAHKLKCKGITIYRYNSKKNQVLYLGSGKKQVSAEPSYSGGCPTEYCSY